MKNLAAYTESDRTPGYLSLNEIDDRIVLTVRERGNGDATGRSVDIVLTREVIDDLVRQYRATVDR